MKFDKCFPFLFNIIYMAKKYSPKQKIPVFPLVMIGFILLAILAGAFLNNKQVRTLFSKAAETNPSAPACTYSGSLTLPSGKALDVLFMPGSNKLMVFSETRAYYQYTLPLPPNPTPVTVQTNVIPHFATYDPSNGNIYILHSTIFDQPTRMGKCAGGNACVTSNLPSDDWPQAIGFYNSYIYDGTFFSGGDKKIQKRDSNPASNFNLLAEWDATDLNGGLTITNDIAFDGSYMYTAAGDRVIKYRIPTPGVSLVPVKQSVTTVNSYRGIVVNSGRRIVFATKGDSIIPFANTDSGFTPFPISYHSNGAEDFRGLALDSAGNLYVANYATGKLDKFVCSYGAPTPTRTPIPTRVACTLPHRCTTRSMCSRLGRSCVTGYCGTSGSWCCCDFN